jgi:hypothetical protein
VLGLHFGQFFTNLSGHTASKSVFYKKASSKNWSKKRHYSISNRNVLHLREEEQECKKRQGKEISFLYIMACIPLSIVLK